MSKQYMKLGKDELRKACKAAGIKYGNLNNDGMRAALEDAYASRNVGATPEEIMHNIAVEQKAIAAALKSGDDAANAAEVSKETPVAPAVPATTGLKIEKNREERNGVKRPSIGGMCRAVWDLLDSVVAAGSQPSAKDVKQAAVTHGWNPNNASIEFYQWRKFNGIRGRQKKA